MSKLALLCTAAMLSLLPVTFVIKDAQARLGRPLTPFSVAGVHRRVMRRNFGVGWRGLGYGAALGTAAYGAGYYGGYGHHYGGCSCPSYGYGGGYGGYGGYGGLGYGGLGIGIGFGRPWGGWGGWGGGWHHGW